MAPNSKHSGRWRLWLIVLGSVIALRIALPYVLLHFVNQRLEQLPGYSGNINDLDLALYRGAYRIEQFNLEKVDSVTQEQTPFISAELIDLSVQWKAFFNGRIVGELDIERPRLRFTIGRTEPLDVQQDTASLGDLLKDLMPLHINRVTLHDGRLEYADEGSRPPLNLALTDLHASATNLSSVVDTSDLVPAKIEAAAKLYGGSLMFNMALDPLSRQSLFDMNLTLEGMHLPEVNDFFAAYANFDVEKGTMSLYTEIATRDGAFKGYVKPIIKDLDVLGREDRNDHLLRKLWEGVVGTAGAILTNPKKDQVATKVVLEGRFDDPDVRTWTAVIDREITISSPLDGGEAEKPGSLQRVFGTKKDSSE